MACRALVEIQARAAVAARVTAHTAILVCLVVRHKGVEVGLEPAGVGIARVAVRHARAVAEEEPGRAALAVVGVLVPARGGGTGQRAGFSAWWC